MNKPATEPHGPPLADVLERFHRDLETELVRWTTAADEAAVDAAWSHAKRCLRELTERPAKRVRPALLALGWLAARGHHEAQPLPPAVVQFAAGLELLHTFMLVHDDVADRAQTRRGGPALHRLLAPGRLGEDLAIVLGDHLYARAVEAMAGAPAATAGRALAVVLEACRHTAAGQYLDLSLARTPLEQVTAFRALKVADLKTARYGFVAPLVAGGVLAGAAPERLDVLRRAGRHAGLAFQLRDDVIGLFGDSGAAGKDGGADFLEGKRTFPVVAAWTRADDRGRRELEALWARPRPEALEAARAAVVRLGGLAVTERLIARRSRAARRALEALPASAALRRLDGLVEGLARRAA